MHQLSCVKRHVCEFREGTSGLSQARKGGLKLIDGAHRFVDGTRFRRGPNIELVSRAYASSFIVELHYITELYA